MPPESLDQRLAQFLRKQRGTLTFSQFARKVGLTESTLHRIENGQQSATLRAVQQILKALRCDYEDIFGGAVRVAETTSPAKTGSTTEAAPTSYKKPRRKKAAEG